MKTPSNPNAAQPQPPAAGEAAHTPTPWICSGALVRNSSGDLLFVQPESRHLVRPIPRATAEANAAFIVRACNAHAGLVVFAGRVQRLMEEPGFLAKLPPELIGTAKAYATEARAALAAAKL